MGRRDRRKAEARQRLLNAAHRLIAENVVADLRIGDVTELADLGFGTFYTYFPSKDALIEAVVAQVLAGLAARREEPLPERVGDEVLGCVSRGERFGDDEVGGGEAEEHEHERLAGPAVDEAFQHAD